jgi:iron complex transport system ATP-binding protein
MLDIKQLGLRIGGRILLERLDLNIEIGQCWSIIGRNGAGKSTLLQTIAGLRDPDNGSIELNGRVLPDWSPMPLAQQRAFLPQSHDDAFGYLVIETVLAARHPYHDRRYWEDSDDHRMANNALHAMDVAHLAQRDVRSLSGGERQRVGIASLLAQDTPLLLLDEPMNALDIGHQIAVMRLLARLYNEAGKTIVMVGHDLNMAYSVATHALLLMGNGEWSAGPAKEVMQAETLSRFLGHPIDVIEHGQRTLFIPRETIE